MWARPHWLVLEELDARGELDWARCAIDSVGVRAAKAHGFMAERLPPPDRRYERKPEHLLAFADIAATLICHRRLAK